MKVCIVGDGIVSLTLAKALVNKGLYVDFFSSQKFRNYDQTRTLGISKSNIDYFNKEIINIDKILWNINKIKIYSENSKKKEILNFSNNNKKLFSILQNYKLNTLLLNNLKKNKFFKIKKNFIYKASIGKNYKIIFNCDSRNEITRKFFFNKLEKKYDSYAYTTIINHKNISLNDIASQIFTNKGPIAFLPISKTKTSVVYSIKNENYKKNINLIELIKKFNPIYEIKNIENISKFELKSSNLRNYYHNNILAFGDMLHKLHPLAGQGFNMSIRDIRELVKLIEYRIKLGLDLDNSICDDFQNITKSKNYLFSIGIDWIYEFFKFEGSINNSILISSVKHIGKNKTINNFFKKVADIGLRV